MTTVALHTGQLLQPVPGGIGRYVSALLEHLPSAGIEPLAFAAGPRPDGVGESVDWVDLGRPSGAARYELWHRFRRSRLRRVACDIVHAPSLAVPPASGHPLVVTVHDVAFLRIPEATTRRGLAFHRRALEITRREADLILTPSRFTRDELVAEGFELERILVAPHGIDLPPPRDEADIDATLAAAGVDPPFILTVGTVEPRKDLPTLADAFTAVRRDDARLTLVIAGPPGWGTVLGLNRPGIRRLGRVDASTLDALYRRALLTCIPSLYEGFGLPALEAMSYASPVVTTNQSALAEVTADVGVLVPPGDADALADALRALVGDEERRAELARLGRERATQYTWTRSAILHAWAYLTALQPEALSGAAAAAPAPGKATSRP